MGFIAKNFNRVKNLFLATIGFIKDIFEKKYLIYELTKRDFKSRYTGSLLGLMWSFIQPIVMMCIMWFVFSFGFKAGKMPSGVSFVAWLFVGMIAWNYFAEAFSASTNVVMEYSFLVKKVNFRLSILPIVKILSALIIHSAFILIVSVVLIANGIYPKVYWLQFLYYLFCMCVLTLGLGWITSSIYVFIKDIGQIVSIVLQFGFWLTPIFWDISLVPEKFRFFIKLNPMWYIIEGYRNSFLYSKPFWQVPYFHHLYFWAFTFFSLLVGIFFYRRLRPHFADVI